MFMPLNMFDISIQLLRCLYAVEYVHSGSIRDDPHWTSRKNSLELIELSSIIKVSLV